MKTNELRIGNFVYALDEFNHGKRKIDKISSITQFGWETIDGHNGIEPIPLTEEWLINLGFKKKEFEKDYWFELNSHKYWKFQTNDTIFNNHKDKWHIGFKGRNGIDYEFLRNLKFVHQLQNLYFALTGKELKIK